MATDFTIVYYYKNGRTKSVRCLSYEEALRKATDRVTKSNGAIYSAQVLGISVLAHIALPKEKVNG